MISPKPFPTPVPDPPEGHERSSTQQTIPPPFDPEAFAQDSEVRLRAAAPATEETTTDEARRLLEDGEPEQALFLLGQTLRDAEASEPSKECAAAVEQECLSMIGPLATILVVAVSADELRRSQLDHVGGFLLSLMDGHTNVETLLDLCGLPRLTALRHLRDLVARGIVEVRKRQV